MAEVNRNWGWDASAVAGEAGAACSCEEQVEEVYVDPEVEEAASGACNNHSTDIHIHVEEEGKVDIERNAEEKEGQEGPSGGVYFAGIVAEEVETCARRAEATAMVVDVDEEPSHSEVENA